MVRNGAPTLKTKWRNLILFQIQGLPPTVLFANHIASEGCKGLLTQNKDCNWGDRWASTKGRTYYIRTFGEDL